MPSPTTDLVRSYLKEIGRYPLLTPEQEITNARLVQQMMAIEQQRQAISLELNRQPTARELATSLGQTEAEVESILHQGERAKQKMVTANLRLVVAIAKKYQNRNLEFLDLIQEGTLGLYRGVEKFDPNQGYKLSTYAYWWVTQSITRAIAQQSRTIRLPIHINERLNKIKKIQRELSQSLGRNPTVVEIAESLKVRPEQVREYIQADRKLVSLEMRVGNEKDTELSELLADENVSPLEELNSSLMRQNIKELLASLAPIQREVLTLRFGLENDHQLSLTQIGERLNLSRERIRQLEHKALSILRRQKSDIKEYLN
ncbi:RpoD/SigA family RNA polymerase sigma factor [Nostoc sp. 'Peltigera membranacea cyanobiont' 232]|uniref:RpoD/SigA family RNA polymerase sigma factor n=1 Tax=Nostoc sp. 'Peltigera membranacea cyanobiont' 232 TaxID=2014531 RepID=UPI000B952DC6|nr:RpoD/SigA family RNA polymerase sigma factor [Nostoc sp. 'Peltigera membranacea cyanobiont' 232]OYE01443.1 RNA polymerase sigma factor, RpoD/SigA family [Nostoc sp. 'Peltigera membranacea cyanobiont' 232]